MSIFKTEPIKWSVTRMLCECGGEFEHKFSTKYKDKPFTHVCNKCNLVEDMEAVYPKTQWHEWMATAEALKGSNK